MEFTIFHKIVCLVSLAATAIILFITILGMKGLAKIICLITWLLLVSATLCGLFYIPST